MKFSERKGYKTPNTEIQNEGMTAELRISIWNVLDARMWSTDGFLYAQYGESRIQPFSRSLWFHYFKKPMDGRPTSDRGILDKIREYFFKCQWYEVYDFLEFVLNYLENQRINDSVNSVLAIELSGYRFVGGHITNLTSEDEISSLSEALSDKDFPGVQIHLKTALSLFSDKKKPDYRNSIKESISAVESMAQRVTKNPKATLGEALKSLKKTTDLHPALKEAFLKLYGYTSDEDGIRHAMLDDPGLGPEDARFFLVACSAFINYLKSKME
ncbi:MAG: hypothetical protein NTX36_11635 [Proteobacteria bacterium]|nr:hypothetical protein [Pseudomonadota bacterium]